MTMLSFQINLHKNHDEKNNFPSEKCSHLVINMNKNYGNVKDYGGGLKMTFE